MGKGSNLKSLLLVEVFVEVAEVNTEALNIKSCQPRQKHCRGKAEAKCTFIELVTSAFYLPAKNAEIRGLHFFIVENTCYT